MQRLEIPSEEEHIIVRLTEMIEADKIPYKNGETKNIFFLRSPYYLKKVIQIKDKLVEEFQQLKPLKRIRKSKKVEKVEEVKEIEIEQGDGVNEKDLEDFNKYIEEQRVNQPEPEPELEKQKRVRRTRQQMKEYREEQARIKKQEEQNEQEQEAIDKAFYNKVEKPEIKERKKLTYKERLDTNPTFKGERLDYLLEKITCPDCEAVITRSAVARHKLSQKHLLVVQNKNTTELINNIKIVENLMSQFKLGRTF